MPGVDLCQIPRFRLFVKVRCVDKLPGADTQIASTLEVALKFLLADFDVKFCHFCIPKETSNRDPPAHTYSLVKLNAAIAPQRCPTSKSTMSLASRGAVSRRGTASQRSCPRSHPHHSCLRAPW